MDSMGWDCSQAARSNGLAESVVKRVSELAKIYVDDDTDIESSLALMEMAMRSTAHTQLLVTPFELLHGREMNVGQPLATGLAPSFTGDHLQYFEQLTKKLTELHKQVCDNRREAKELYKRDYDKRNKVAEAPRTVGQKVVVMYNVLSSLAACGRLGVSARPACLFGKRPVARDQ